MSERLESVWVKPGTGGKDCRYIRGSCNPQLEVGEGDLRRKARVRRGARFKKGRGPGEVGALRRQWEGGGWRRHSGVPAFQLRDTHSAENSDTEN